LRSRLGCIQLAAFQPAENIGPPLGKLTVFTCLSPAISRPTHSMAAPEALFHLASNPLAKELELDLWIP
jgi:hypothetical protein